MRPYSVNPALISIKDFRELTAGKQMQPGRKVLQEKINERFTALEEAGIRNLGELISLLGTKSKMISFSQRTGLASNYLVLLKREAGSYLPRPHPLSGFPGIPFEYTELFKSRGIRNSKELFEQLPTDQEQGEFSLESGIPAYRIKELFTLCELSRITGVGGLFARVLYETGIRTPGDYAKADPSILLENCRTIIKKHEYAAGNLGMKDILYGKYYARFLVRFDNKSIQK
jgi:hypothetical protein